MARPPSPPHQLSTSRRRSPYGRSFKVLQVPVCPAAGNPELSHSCRSATPRTGGRGHPPTSVTHRVRPLDPTFALGHFGSRFSELVEHFPLPPSPKEPLLIVCHGDDHAPHDRATNRLSGDACGVGHRLTEDSPERATTRQDQPTGSDRQGRQGPGCVQSATPLGGAARSTDKVTGPHLGAIRHLPRMPRCGESVVPSARRTGALRPVIRHMGHS